MSLTPHVMLRARITGACLAVAVLLGTAGCQTSTIASRTKEMQTTFDAATPDQQATVKTGWIDYNFSPGLVYIALGKPDRIINLPDGTVKWVYMNYAADAPNSALGGVKIKAYQTKDGGSTGGTVDARGVSTRASNAAVDTRAKMNFESVPDVGSTPPAMEIPELHIYFYNGHANRVQIKRGM